MSGDQPAGVFVFAPSPILTVTIERGADDAAEIHLHAGGQGLWVTRLVRAFGLPVAMSGAFGGESGHVLLSLVDREEICVRPIAVAARNGAYVHDRRGGERYELAQMDATPLTRHEIDAVYGAALVEGLEATVTVITGTGLNAVLPDDVYRRLPSDLRAAEKHVVADLSGDYLRAALAGGLTLLKVSHEELIDGGWAADDTLSTLVTAIQNLHAEGADNVVVSRAAEPALALLEGELYEVVTPSIETVDPRGAGDSMTAAMAVAIARGDALLDAVRLGAAAGALNVTRRGLATSGRQEIERLAAHVDIRPLHTASTGGHT